MEEVSYKKLLDNNVMMALLQWNVVEMTPVVEKDRVEERKIKRRTEKAHKEEEKDSLNVGAKEERTQKNEIRG